MSHPQTYVVYRFEEKDGDLKRAEVAWQDPKAGEVIVKVLACGVCGTDDHVRAGMFPTPFPRVPGHEIVGDIVAVPEGETVYKVGDRVGSGWHGGQCGRCDNCGAGDFIVCEKQDINGVFRDGGYAEYTALRVEALTRVPTDMDPAEVAPLFCAGVTTFNAIRNMKIRAGEIAAVQGIGGLGHLAIQYCRAMGFRTVALSSGASKEELARKLGAHDYIDGSKVDAAKALQDMGGAKVIVATAPSSGSIQKLLPGLGLEGQLLILGISDDVTTINFTSLIAKRQSIIGWPAGTAKDADDTIKFSRLQNVNCMVERFPLDKAQEAYDHKTSAKFRAVIVPNHA
ncbi:hypothetical protein EW026_g6733 [Hermanssonia centrifuga]|uniref:Enoyl reductase (ER) domain-containing protein n=1 Tax=Hermanssonia centrifuga TaxID=98765 RepID=A0A4S4KA38_9APHY|nr:hypothetical protein EW026_g6733 [Hermanssonia centrifuga]